MSPGLSAFFLARPVVDEVLRHGYRLSQLNALAITLVRRSRFHQGEPLAERVEVAWSGMVEHLYTCTEPPGVGDLLDAGSASVHDCYRRAYKSWGYHPDRLSAGTHGGFARYWTTIASHAASPEEPVVERTALCQIWPTLTERQRTVVVAMATHEDRHQAAASVGLTISGFEKTLASARRGFLALWHEGERPSRLWMMTTRRSAPYAGPRTIMVQLRKKRRRAMGLAPVPRVTFDPGISREELEERYLTMPRVKLAAQLGITSTGLAAYMDRVGIDRKALEARKKIRQALRE